MAQPTPKVYLAINQSPYLASPTWTEITSYVMSADTYRGRDNDWQDTQSGTASITLNNNTRIWDPAYTAGTYYGQLIPRMQIKITGTISATEYDVFRGYISGWPVQYDNAGATATVTLSCYDALGLLAQDQLPADWSADYILSKSPVHFYKCNDRNNSPTIADYGSALEPLSQTTVPGFRPLTSSQQLEFGLQSVSADLTNSVYVKYNTGNTPTTGDATIAFFGAFSNSSATESVFGISSVTASSNIAIYPNTPNQGNVYVEVYNDSAATGFAYCLDDATTSTPAFYTITYTASTGAIKIFINGVDRTQTTGPYAPSNRTGVKLFPTRAVTLTGAQFQSVSMYNKILTTAEIQAIYDLSLALFYETTAARYARILANTAFPVGLESISATSTAYALGITDDSPNLTSELQLNNRTEGGLCFVSKSGVLTTKSRYEQFSYGYTDQLPLTSTTNTGFDPSINISLDADEMANDVAITWTNNNVDSITNAASVTAYGQKQQPFTTQLSTYDEAIALANMKVGLGQYPRPKLSEHRVNPANNSTTWANILDMELYERYSLAVAPKVGNATTYTLLMQSVSHRIEPGRWECRFKGSNIYASAFRLDLSLLDGPDVLLYAQ